MAFFSPGFECEFIVFIFPRGSNLLGSAIFCLFSRSSRTSFELLTFGAGQDKTGVFVDKTFFSPTTDEIPAPSAHKIGK